MIAPKRAPNDKSGIGFDNDKTFVYKPRYNKVNFNYNNDRHGRDTYRRPHKYMHNYVFERKANNKNYFHSACIHCSLFTHDSLHCPNRFRINTRKYMWVVKTQKANPLGPKST